MRPILLAVALLVSSTLHAAVVLEQIASGLDQPVSITHAGDARLFITLQRGTVVIWDGTRVLPTPFLDVRDLVSCCSERGLLSIAFHPRYAENGLVFVYYTDRNGDIVIARYTRLAGDANRLDPATATQLLKISHPAYANHNGGQLQFGRDGYLYAGTGDGGSGGDPNNNAQNLTSLLGKILRLDVDTAIYTIPASNPFVGRSSARNEIWAYGLRNPWRFSFDRATGDLWIGDVGQGSWEEIDFQPATSIGSENYGWRRMEGTHCYNPSSNCSEPGMVLPVLEYGHNPECSVTGGYRYRGTRSPALRGKYIYADYCSGKIWAAAFDGTALQPELVKSTGFFIPTFGEDANGELYVSDLKTGSVYRIVDDTPVSVVRRRAVGR